MYVASICIVMVAFSLYIGILTILGAHGLEDGEITNASHRDIATEFTCHSRMDCHLNHRWANEQEQEATGCTKYLAVCIPYFTKVA